MPIESLKTRNKKIYSSFSGEQAATSHSNNDLSLMTSSVTPVNVASVEGQVNFVAKDEEGISLQNARVQNVIVPRILKQVFINSFITGRGG